VIGEAEAQQGTHRALCICISSFRRDPGSDEVEGPPDRFPPLPFAHQRSQEMRDVLRQLGYKCETSEESLSAADLGQRVNDSIRGGRPTDVFVVHVVSHGLVTPSGELHVVGGDGEYDDRTAVQQWLRLVVDSVDQPPVTLFLLDICYAGEATRLRWQQRFADAHNRAWVIAACGPQESAFSGRFTKATVEVLQSLANGDLGIDRSRRYAPITTVARSIRRAVANADNDRYLSQQVVASLLDISSEPPDLPFFQTPGS
jgi:hypothetical protein